MNFEHKPIALDPISSEDTPHGRFYATPGGRFPSVTTVLGWYRGDQWLKDWQARVGEDEARKIGTRARIRGTAVHEIAEAYVKNDPDWREGAMPANLYSFLSVKPHLDARLGAIFGVEVPLWSSRLRTAGRTDLLAEWDGVPSVVDFKTSVKNKSEGEISSYFVQKACYGEMVLERVGLDLPQIVTVMMVDHEPPQIWVKRRRDFSGDVQKIFIDAPRRGEEQE